MAEAAASRGQQLALKIVVPLDAPDVPIVYANHVQASVTPEDLTMHLGWYTIPPFTEPPEEDVVEIPVRPLVKVTLPLILVRGIIQVLEEQVKAWEANFRQAVPQHPMPPGGRLEQDEEEER